MRYSFLAILLVVFFSCNRSSELPDISEIDIEWEFVPFHLLQKELQSIENDLPKMQREYPAFTNVFFSSVIPITSISQEEAQTILLDPLFSSLIDTSSLVYKDWESSIRSELDEAFKYYAHYTGDHNIPNVYTYVSGFAYQNFIFQENQQKDGLGIGIDMFLGESFPYKSIDPKNPTFSEFLTQYFDKKYIARKSLLAWLDDKIPPTQSGQLLDIIIRNGKILYILEKILPKKPTDIVLEFQPNQYEWCKLNEPELWTHLLKNDLLYSDNFQRINKLINPSPSVPGIPQEAPGGVANYIGWRIVQDYMARTNVSFGELIQNEEFQTIMDESKYRPRVRK